MNNSEFIEYNEINLLIIFDEIMPSTDEELKQFRLKRKLSNGQELILSFSVYENTVGIFVGYYLDKKKALLSCSFENCKEIKELSVEGKIIEISFSNSEQKILLNLSEEAILIDINP